MGACHWSSLNRHMLPSGCPLHTAALTGTPPPPLQVPQANRHRTTLADSQSTFVPLPPRASVLPTMPTLARGGPGPAALGPAPTCVDDACPPRIKSSSSAHGSVRAGACM